MTEKEVSKRRFALGLTALFLLAAFLIPVDQASDASADAVAEIPIAETPISSVPQQLLHNFSIFRTPPEVVPLKIVEGTATINEQPPPTGGHGFNVALGQKVTTPGKRAPLWAVPGRDRIALWQPKKPALWGGSATIATAVRKGVAFSTPVPRTDSPQLVEVKGLVPDGITAVKFSRSAVAPVLHNAFARRLDEKKLWQSRSWIFVRRR